MAKAFNRKCFACKQSIDIFDENLDISNLVLVDERFYHKDCYNKMKLIKKKCYQCKKDIIYGSDYKDKGVYYDKHFYHDDCFTKWCTELKNITPKRKFALENKSMFEQEYTKTMDGFLKSRLSNKKTIEELNYDAVKTIQRIRDESDFNSYIKETYNLNLLSTEIWKRLDSVYKGTYKNLDKPIPVEHLSYMWKEKQNTLNKIYRNNISKGKDFSNEGRVLYDLAVIVKQYDKFLEWLDKQRLKEADDVKTNDNINLVTNLASKMVKNKSNEINDLSKTLDEVFG